MEGAVVSVVVLDDFWCLVINIAAIVKDTTWRGLGMGENTSIQGISDQQYNTEPWKECLGMFHSFKVEDKQKYLGINL